MMPVAKERFEKVVSTPKKRLLERSKKAATKAATYLAYDTYIIVPYNVQPAALLGVLQNKFSM